MTVIEVVERANSKYKPIAASVTVTWTDTPLTFIVDEAKMQSARSGILPSWCPEPGFRGPSCRDAEV